MAAKKPRKKGLKAKARKASKITGSLFQTVGRTGGWGSIG